MALSGLQVINIGLQNESVGSDSLYTAFNKTKTNFATLFANASPYNTFTPNIGISLQSNSTTGVLDIRNEGVCNIIAGTNVVVTPKDANGNVTISTTGGGGGGGGTVTSVGLVPASASRLTISGSPIISSGNITIDLATSGVVAGTYTYPSVTVDAYGRVTSISSAASVGTVTSVAVSPGSGIGVTGSPITTNGTITITNTGVTSLSAGSGISLNSSNGNVTITALPPTGIVTYVDVTSSTLTVSGNPITTAGTITINIPSSISLSTLSSNVNYTPFSSLTAATGVVTHNIANGAIFNHSSISANFTVNVTNLNLSSSNATNMVLILNQGATAYVPTAFQIGGVAQTILWLNGSQPGGTATKTDIVTFSIANVSSTYKVYGILNTYG